MKGKLARIFEELLREIETNPHLKARIELILSPEHEQKAIVKSASRPKNRRKPPAVDPYAEIKGGEAILRQKLALLSLDQLKDVVSGYALDASRLASKWKDQARLIDLIVTTVRSRVEKGDGFRSDALIPPP
jgi:hypothetical protein